MENLLVYTNNNEYYQYYYYYPVYENEQYNTNINTNIIDKYSYNNIGKKEGRLYRIPDDFNYEVYKKIYKELDNKSDIEIEIDYLLNWA